MSIIKLAFTISLGLCLACMAAAFFRLNAWGLMFLGLSMGLLWGFQVWQERRTYSFSFLGLLALLAYGTFMKLPAAWLLVGMVSLLVAWDLGEFNAHLAEFKTGQISPSLVHNHLRRILYVAVVGLALGGIALLIKFQLTFGAAVLLGLLVFAGLAGAVRFLRGTL